MASVRFQFKLRTALVVTTVLSVLFALNLRPQEQQGSFWNVIDSRQESFGWPFHVYVHYDCGYASEITAARLAPVFDLFSVDALVGDVTFAIAVLAAAVFVSERGVGWCIKWSRRFHRNAENKGSGL